MPTPAEHLRVVPVQDTLGTQAVTVQIEEEVEDDCACSQEPTEDKDAPVLAAATVILQQLQQ